MKDDTSPVLKGLCRLLALLIAVAFFLGINDLSKKSGSKPTKESQPTSKNKTATMVATTSNYQLLVGANPRLGEQQKLSPPTNSVVITNGEVQLQMLREQAKKSRQHVQQ